MCIVICLLSYNAFEQTITTVAGGGINSPGDGGFATSSILGYISDVIIDSSGNILIADGYNNRIRKVNNTGIITTIAGTGVAGYNGDNLLAINAQLNAPQWIALDAIGNIYLADNGNNRIRKIDRLTGIITTFVGNGVAGYNGNNILVV